jgi:hypothetical protein
MHKKEENDRIIFQLNEEIKRLSQQNDPESK